MPYQESSLGERLSKHPKGHRGYATPGVSYRKGKFKAGVHVRPVVVSGRPLDRRLGLDMGQQKSDKDPFKENVVKANIPKAKESKNRRLLQKVKNTVEKAESKRLSGLELMSEAIENAMEFSVIKKAKRYGKLISGKTLKESQEKLAKIPKKKSLGERMKSLDPKGMGDSPAYTAQRSRVSAIKGETSRARKRLGRIAGATAAGGALVGGAAKLKKKLPPKGYHYMPDGTLMKGDSHK
jgi:hypothetical protein